MHRIRIGLKIPSRCNRIITTFVIKPVVFKMKDLSLMISIKLGFQKDKSMIREGSRQVFINIRIKSRNPSIISQKSIQVDPPPGQTKLTITPSEIKPIKPKSNK